MFFLLKFKYYDFIYLINKEKLKKHSKVYFIKKIEEYK